MTVVVIVTVLAAIAVPAVGRQMKDRRANQATQQVADLYRGARMRALGRGSVVLVRYKHTGGFDQGAVEVWEAMAPTGAASCAAPTRGCQTNTWPTVGQTASIASAQLLNGLNVVNRKEFGDVDISMRMPGGAATDTWDFLDVCFTPLGATYSRTVSTSPLTMMTGVPVAQVTRPSVAGRREVLILPNGTARVKGLVVP
jgi:type II secretory pathway pseudopilin PulG